MGFISWIFGTVLFAQAISTAGIGPAVLSVVLWALFGFFFGLPPLIGLFFSLPYWKPSEAFAGFVVQAALFGGALWIFEAAGLGELTVLFVVFSGINGLLMAPAMVKERQDQLNAQQN